MEFNLNENREVVALLGAGSMGTAIIKRISTNRIILLGDINEDNLKAREEELKFNGYSVETQVVDAMDAESVEAFAKRASELGDVKYYIHTAVHHRTRQARSISLTWILLQHPLQLTYSENICLKEVQDLSSQAKPDT